MPGTLDRYKGFPAMAGSAINPGIPVKFGGNIERGVVPIVPGGGDLAVGMMDTRVGSAAQGEAVTVYEHGAVVEGLAAASIGQAGEVAFTASQGFAPISAASGSAKFSVGVAMTPANPGEYFALYVRPRALSGLV